MPEHRWVYVRRKQSETGQTGTATYDLPARGFIDLIVLRAFSTPTASTDPALPLNDAITKIELVDGGTVIKSITGNQAHGLEMVHLRQKKASTEVNDNAVEGIDDFYLVLGTFAQGQAFAADFSRFRNPQIRISWDYSLTTGARGATFDADATPAMKFTVLAHVLEAAPGLVSGYLKSVQLREFTSANSAVVQTELPLGEQMIGLAIEAGWDDDDWTEDVEKIRLDFDNGKWIPVDIFEEEVVPFQQEIFGRPFELSFNADIKDGVEIDSHMGWVKSVDINVVGVAGGSFANWPVSTIGVEEIFFQDSVGAAIAAYQQGVFNVVGYMPYGLWYLPMSALQGVGSDLVDTTRFGRIILEITQGSSVNTSSTPAILAEYLVRQ